MIYPESKLTPQQQIAVEHYTANGCTNWAQAMLAAKYSESYTRHSGSLVLSKTVIQQAIAAKLAEIRAESKYTRQIAESHYEQVRQLALQKGDLPSANTAIKGKNRLHAFESDKIEVEAYPGRLPAGAVERSQQRIAAAQNGLNSPQIGSGCNKEEGAVIDSQEKERTREGAEGGAGDV